MNYRLYCFLTVFSIVLMTSCEKVIEVKVDDAAKKYVIEGVLTDKEEGCQVRVSQTKGISEDNTFIGVTGLEVRLLEENGAVVNLIETLPGIYKSSLMGVPGKQYTLQVNINGQMFTATSKMPQPVALDSLYISSLDMLGSKEYYANVVYKDPAGKGNAYRFLQYINGQKTKDVFVQNDDLSNGQLNTITLFSQDDLQDELKAGDQVRVEMFSIDALVYKYWFSLGQGATGTGSASPANPTTNISGGALGYFSAHTNSAKEVILK